MNPSLAVSKSGMNGLQTNLDIVANNIANSNTVGFKEKDTNFHELLREDTKSRENLLLNGISRGMKSEQAQLNMTQGGFIPGSNDFDLALVGDGFFGVRLPNNQMAYTRDGSFRFDANGTLRTSNGNQVDINYLVPKNNWPNGSATVSERGEVTVGNQLVAQIPVYATDRYEQFQETGDNLFQLPQGTNAQVMNNPTIKQYYLEASNVDLADQMTDMIVTQRVYSMNTKVAQSTDEMMQIINNFKQ
ncbi:flagellar hook-basal body protein [Vagococcus hydrophili]|uniref:Flagellar hook-basal body protein n=1 Tax=Vagococcus hydrophili TaxID=2714947 RepID=A0A6G8AWL1_9ENTE|nr:flagellar hook-basal body protein [Vagococcus hydrophili]QIL49335.1 flagellar hook-basal body protein [Vagococcus hydrophili]